MKFNEKTFLIIIENFRLIFVTSMKLTFYMTENIVAILHWNTDYAEFPRSEIPNVVKKSYIPMLDSLEGLNSGKICFNITGHSLEYFEKNYPEIIEKLKNLIKSDTVELLGSGYSHPILPLLPKLRQREQIISHKNKIEKLFHINLKGVWPPELAISNSTLNEFKSASYDWITIDHEYFVLNQNFHNDFNDFERREKTATEIMTEAYWASKINKIISYLRAYRKVKKWKDMLVNPLLKVKIDEKNFIKIFLASVSWTYSTIFGLQGIPPLFSLNKHIKSIKEHQSFCIPLYCSDIEFFGYRSFEGNAPRPKNFVDLIKTLEKSDINLISPSSIPNENWIEDDGYIFTGSWSPNKTLRIWTHSEDNCELTRRLNEIYSKLNLSELSEETLKLLRIAENSDARGWSPSNERKTEAFSAIEKLYKLYA